MIPNTPTLEEVMRGYSHNSAITYTSASAGIIGGFSTEKWLAIGGFLIALLSFLYNVWKKEKQEKRHLAANAVAAELVKAEEARRIEEHNAKMAVLHAELNKANSPIIKD